MYPRSIPPLAFIVALGVVSGCSDSPTDPSDNSPPVPAAPAAPLPATIQVLSGDGQTGKTGERLAEPLVVRVTTTSGLGVPDARVIWTVTSGQGSMFTGTSPVPVVETRTTADGTSYVIFTPRSFGRVRVTASVAATTLDPATFETEVTTYVFTNVVDAWSGPGFYGPDFEVDAAVPLGTTVEWVNLSDKAVRINVFAVPPGAMGPQFTLESNDRYPLEVSVAGKWDWSWKYVGEDYLELATLSVGDVPPGASLSVLSQRVRDRYAVQYDVSVPKPAFVNSAHASGCQDERHLLTTAWLPTQVPNARRLIAMYLSPDGRWTMRRSDQTLRAIPAGTFTVLTVLLTYPETTGEDALALLQNAQEEINEQHAQFAVDRGYASPIVQFEFTNTGVPGRELYFEPRTLAAMRAELGDRGVNVDDYDFVVVLNPDPLKIEGGLARLSASPPYFVYVGNFNMENISPWTTQLAARDFTSIAWAAYQHEIAHHWGWQHDWAPTCGNSAHDAYFAPFITDPALFGWEDTDGDGVPEILDPNPYGR